VLVLATLLALAILARRARRAAPEAPAWADLWAGATFVLLLVSPGSWTVHYALAFLPAVVLATRARQGSRAAAAALIALGLAATLPAFSGAIAEAVAFAGALPLAALLGLGVLVMTPPSAERAGPGW
jgi:hypothetical protein